MMKSSRNQPRSQGLLRFQDGVDPGNEVELKSFDIHGVFVLPRIFSELSTAIWRKGTEGGLEEVVVVFVLYLSLAVRKQQNIQLQVRI